MENNTYKSDGLTENVIAQILELFPTYRLFEVEEEEEEEEEAKLKAICDDVLIHDTKSANE